MTRRALVFVAAIAMTLGFLALGQAAQAAPTTTSTTQQCNRSDVKTITPIKITNLTATVSFQLLNGCHLPVGLASYTNTGPKYDPAHVSAEVLVDHQTGHFSADGITHTLSVKIPDCYYEVDFFFGDLITQFQTNHQYLGELVGAVNAGTMDCVQGSGTTTTTTIDAPTSTTTIPVQVEAQTIVAKQLPHTGMNLTPLVILGLCLFAIGGSLLWSAEISRRCDELAKDRK